MGDPVLSWWWSGLVDDNDDRTWEWAHCNLINTILFFSFLNFSWAESPSLMELLE